MSQISTVFDYNGAKYEFDIRDADDAAKYEEALEQMKVKESELPKDGKTSGIIKAHCAMIKSFFDVILEEGAGEAVCGKKNNISACYDAYEAFLAFATKQKDDIVRAKNVFAQYSNRQQRRAAAKKP